MELTIIDREHYLELVHLQLALGLCTTDFQQQLEHYAYAETKALEMSGYSGWLSGLQGGPGSGVRMCMLMPGRTEEKRNCQGG